MSIQSIASKLKKLRSPAPKISKAERAVKNFKRKASRAARRKQSN